MNESIDFDGAENKQTQFYKTTYAATCMHIAYSCWIYLLRYVQYLREADKIKLALSTFARQTKHALVAGCMLTIRSVSLALPDPTLKYREGVRGQTTCAIEIS